MTASSQELQSYKQKVWEKINLLCQVESNIIYRQDNEISFIYFASQIQLKDKTRITFKRNTTSVIIEAAPLQKLSEQFSYEQQYFLTIASKVNKDLTKDEIVIWMEQDQNFTAKKITLYQCLKQSYPNTEDFFKSSIRSLRQILQKCKNETSQTHLLIRNKKSIENRINLLQHLKFQFQVNRKQRDKTTNIDFNHCQIKSIAELILLKEQCSKSHKNYMAALREKQLRSTVNGKQALNNYCKIVQSYRRKKEDSKTEQAGQEKEKILSPIKIRSCKQVNQQLQGTFSHIEVVQSQFSIIFSLNMKTTELISNQMEEISYMKDRNCVLVKKKKCEGRSGESDAQRKINELVFQNEKQMLILLNPYFHKSICSFYVEQYCQRKDIKEIYSKKLPSDPISKFMSNFEPENPIKSLKSILRFLTEVAEGVQFLSSHETLHRDLKPTNVMLDQKGSAKIIDFGSSCPAFGSALEKNLTKDFDIKLRSTKGYYQKYGELPSEVSSKYAKQEYDRHISFDVYSLGAIAQFLIPQSIGLKEKYVEQLQTSIQYFIKKCKDIHPDDRMTSLEAVIFLKQLTHLCEKITDK